MGKTERKTHLEQKRIFTSGCIQKSIDVTRHHVADSRHTFSFPFLYCVLQLSFSPAAENLSFPCTIRIFNCHANFTLRPLLLNFCLPLAISVFFFIINATFTMVDTLLRMYRFFCYYYCHCYDF